MPAGRPYGSWPSPITAASLVEGVSTPTELVVDGSDIWWAETRPAEGGRTALVRWRAGWIDGLPATGKMIDGLPATGKMIDGSPATGEMIDGLPATSNVRSLVHEYGGGAWWVQAGVVVFSDAADQRLWRLGPNDTDPVPLTPEPISPQADRFADGRFLPGGAWYVCVRERHGDGEPVNELVAVATDGSLQVRSLHRAADADFVASPRPSPDGTRLAWIQWTHPNMPWDDTELWVADLVLDPPDVAQPRCLAGHGGGESIVQPAWTPAGRLHVVSDRSDWWGLYEIDPAGPPGSAEAPLVPGSAESPLVPVRVIDGEEMAEPDWVFGRVRHTVTSAARLVCAPVCRPVDRLEIDGRPALLPGISTVQNPQEWNGGVVVLAGSHAHGPVVLAVDGATGSTDVIRPPHPHGHDPGFLPPPEPLTFTTTGGAQARALFYRPAHPEIAGPASERPPLIVLAHGGPTSAAANELSLALRFWTSRGIAVVDVDYRGSTGYGRAYRRALYGQWGVADVDDCIAAVEFLAARGDIDADRVAVRGGSAGGFTVLRALCTSDVFSAGVSRYGIADLEALATDTHKFESRYIDQLVGPYPERRDVYVERSPIHHVDSLGVPMLVLQGLDDPIVPPNQAEMIVAALEHKNVPVSCLAFAGEGHGFRKAENIITALEAELAFLGEVFGFEPAEPLPPVAWRGVSPRPR